MYRCRGPVCRCGAKQSDYSRNIPTGPPSGTGRSYHENSHPAALGVDHDFRTQHQSFPSHLTGCQRISDAKTLMAQCEQPHRRGLKGKLSARGLIAETATEIRHTLRRRKGSASRKWRATTISWTINVPYRQWVIYLICPTPSKCSNSPEQLQGPKDLKTTSASAISANITLLPLPFPYHSKSSTNVIYLPGCYSPRTQSPDKLLTSMDITIERT